MGEQSHGYHNKTIIKGVLGQTSKIREELDELMDAEEQGVFILQAVELSDLYGAIEAYAETLRLSMEDLRMMSNLTKRAFESGRRK